MSQETVEYLLRQQSKVRQPKTLVKVVRAHTRELKRATRREHEKAQVEALSGIAREAIRGSFDIVERGVEATGSVLSSLAGNPNPLSQGIIIGGGIVGLMWLNTWHPGVARALGLDKLIFPGHKGYDLDNSGIFCVRYKPLLAGETTQCFDSDAERRAFLDDQPGVRALNPILFEKEAPFPGGQFCIFLRGSTDARTQCYETMMLRDEAFDTILRSSPELLPEKINR